MLQASTNVEGKASGETPKAGGAGDRPDEKGHWKLRALANIRRHSDTDIFVNSAQGRSPPSHSSPQAESFMAATIS